MCGICGVYNYRSQEPVDQDLLQRMTRAMSHRGPDDEGLFTQGSVGLGNRRLAIVDLSPAGHMPMTNKDKSIWITFNGEIYNHPELKAALEVKGYRYLSSSDTESVLHAYEEYGEECVTHLRGMFGFAIWDSREQKLFIARDRLGIKPLYYLDDGKSLLFASELKVLIQKRDFPRRVNHRAIDSFLSFRVVPEPETIFQGIRALMPGHTLTCWKGKVTLRQYWDIASLKGEVSRGLDYYTERLQELLKEAVKGHMMSDVPLGAFLSGGVDSSTIVALMSHFSTSPIRTFTIGFGVGENLYNETHDARRVSEHFGTQHHELVMDPGGVEKDLPDLVWYMEQPASTPIPSYYISRLAAQDVKVAMSGLGGDELFAGYPRHIGFRLARIFSHIPSPLRRGVISPLIRALPGSIEGSDLVRRAQRFVRGEGLAPFEEYVAWALFFSEKEKRELYSPGFSEEVRDGDTRELLQRTFDSSHSERFPEKVLYVDLKTYLPNDLLNYTDRMSMAHSLEVRVPFLDHRLVEFAATIPYDLKLKGFTSKYIFKQAIRGILPKGLIKKKKHGFVFPMGLWIQKGLKATTLEALSPENINKRGYFDHQYVDHLLKQHFQGKRDYTYEIWSLVILELWHQAFMDSR